MPSSQPASQQHCVATIGTATGGKGAGWLAWLAASCAMALPPLYLEGPQREVQLSDILQSGKKRLEIFRQQSEALADDAPPDIPEDEDVLGHFALRFSCSAVKGKVDGLTLWWVKSEALLFRRRLLAALKFASKSTEDLIVHCCADRWLTRESDASFKCKWTKWLAGVGRFGDAGVHLDGGWLHLTPHQVILALVEDFQVSMSKAAESARLSCEYMYAAGDSPFMWSAKALQQAALSVMRPSAKFSRANLPRIDLCDLAKQVRTDACFRLCLCSQLNSPPAPFLVQGDEDGKAVQNFPLCMRNSLRRLLDEKHLKYDARLQLSLFLKGCGMCVEDVAALWKTNGLEAVKYQKTLPGLYGLTGSRVNYTPYNCDGILRKGKPQTPQQAHGCPFAHWELPALRRGLASTGVSEADLEDIVTAKARGPKSACTRHLEALLHREMDEDIHSPNLWYEKSCAERGAT